MSDNPQWRDILQDTWQVVLKSMWVITDITTPFWCVSFFPVLPYLIQETLGLLTEELLRISSSVCWHWISWFLLYENLCFSFFFKSCFAGQLFYFCLLDSIVLLIELVSLLFPRAPQVMFSFFCFQWFYYACPNMLVFFNLPFLRFASVLWFFY